jgi:hypothetical protein
MKSHKPIDPSTGSGIFQQIRALEATERSAQKTCSCYCSDSDSEADVGVVATVMVAMVTAVHRPRAADHWSRANHLPWLLVNDLGWRLLIHYLLGLLIHYLRLDRLHRLHRLHRLVHGLLVHGLRGHGRHSLLLCRVDRATCLLIDWLCVHPEASR